MPVRPRLAAMSTESRLWRRRAERDRDAAARERLPNARMRLEHSAAAYERLAESVERGEAMRASAAVDAEVLAS